MITEANLAQCTAGHGARQPQRELIASMKTKKARPATDTGMPPLVPAGILDQTLVVTATQLIAGACAVGLLGACFGATSAWFQESLHRLATIDAPGLLAQHGALAAGIGAVLILVPAAAWLALRKE